MIKVRYLVYCSCILLLSACSLATKVEKTSARNIAKGPYDAIIVPGYPYRDAKYPELFISRIHFAKELYDKGITKNIIFSGAAVHTPYIEGTLMKTFADSLGVNPNHTFAEVEAEHSNQNASFGYRMAKRLGFKKVAIASDPFQFSYMILLRGLYAPKTKLISFPPSQMGAYIKPLPVVDTSSSFLKDFKER